MLDVEVLGWCGYTWSVVLRPIGCTDKFSCILEADEGVAFPEQEASRVEQALQGANTKRLDFFKVINGISPLYSSLSCPRPVMSVFVM